MRSLLSVSILGLTLGIGLSEAHEGWLVALVGILLAVFLLAPQQGVVCGHEHHGQLKTRTWHGGVWILLILHHIFDGVLLGIAVMSNELLITLPVLFHEVPKSIALVEHLRNQGTPLWDAWRRMIGLALWCVPGAILGWYCGASVQKLATHLHPLGGGLAIGIASLILYRRLTSVQGARLRTYTVIVIMGAVVGFSAMHYFHHELLL